MTAVNVTGIGVLAPNGSGIETFWKSTVEGRSGLGGITRFDPAGYPSRLAGEVDDFVAEDHLPNRLLPQTDPMTRMALVAADWALADAGIDPSTRDPFSMGVVTASSAGGFEFGQRELQKLWSQGSEYVSAYQSFAWFYAVNSGQISIRHGMRGPSGVVVSDQAGGLDAIAQARRQLRRGTDVVVTGGVDSILCPWGWVAQMATGRVSAETDPARAYRPFDARANGFVPGEGGAVLVVEDGERGASGGYGRICGYAATFDPRPGSGREPGLRRAIELALADAEVGAGDVDVVFADAAGTPELDRIEAEAIAGVFGPAGVPVTAPKTMTGRLTAGAGSLDVVAALLSIRDAIVPPTVNVTEPYPACPIDLVTTARSLPVRTALVLARGEGGFNAAVVVRGPQS